jgi:hypothetical protein
LARIDADTIDDHSEEQEDIVGLIFLSRLRGTERAKKELGSILLFDAVDMSCLKSQDRCGKMGATDPRVSMLYCFCMTCLIVDVEEKKRGGKRKELNRVPVMMYPVEYRKHCIALAPLRPIFLIFRLELPVGVEYRFFYFAYLPPAILVQLVLLEDNDRLVNVKGDLIVGFGLKVVDRPHSFGHG